MKALKAGHGGARSGAGRKPGIPNKATLAATEQKEVIREEIRREFAAELRPLLRAQIDHAKGIKHLMMREPKTGKFERVAVSDSDPAVAAAQIDAALTSGNAFWIYTKDPSTQAWTDLANRVIDKPAEQVQEVAHSGTILVKHEL